MEKMWKLHSNSSAGILQSKSIYLLLTLGIVCVFLMLPQNTYLQLDTAVSLDVVLHYSHLLELLDQREC